MKQAVIIVLVMFCATAGAKAESDFTPRWSIGEFTGVTLDLVQLDLDVNLGSRFLSVYGAFKLGDGSSIPADGSCYMIEDGGVSCGLQVGSFTARMVVAEDLDGLITVLFPDGSEPETATVTFEGLQSSTL